MIKAGDGTVGAEEGSIRGMEESTYRKLPRGPPKLSEPENRNTRGRWWVNTVPCVSSWKKKPYGVTEAEFLARYRDDKIDRRFSWGEYKRDTNAYKVSDGHVGGYFRLFDCEGRTKINCRSNYRIRKKRKGSLAGSGQ